MAVGETARRQGRRFETARREVRNTIDVSRAILSSNSRNTLVLMALFEKAVNHVMMSLAFVGISQQGNLKLAQIVLVRRPLNPIRTA